MRHAPPANKAGKRLEPDNLRLADSDAVAWGFEQDRASRAKIVASIDENLIDYAVPHRRTREPSR